MEKIIIKKRPFCKEDLLTIILIIPMLYYAGLSIRMKSYALKGQNHIAQWQAQRRLGTMIANKTNDRFAKPIG